MCLVNHITVFLSLIYVYWFSGVGTNSDFIDKEIEFLEKNGVCASQNITPISQCGEDEWTKPATLRGLKHLSCYCDADCHAFHDCCIDRATITDIRDHGYACRDIRGQQVPRIPIYVYQRCPKSWMDHHIRDMCEVEATDRQQRGLDFDHLQDIPVLSESSRRFYRNIYCAACNDDTNVVKWEVYIYCNGGVELENVSMEDEVDFSNAVYVPKTMNYRGVMVMNKKRNCQIVSRNFNMKRLVPVYGARLCKPAIGNCPKESDENYKLKCDAYSSYVYEKTFLKSRGKVFKNYFCALCNNVNSSELSCMDPYVSPIFTGPTVDFERSSLAMLFDFKFRGGERDVGNQSPCLLNQGQVWDPVFRKCLNFTCGSGYERKETTCVPTSTSNMTNELKNNCRRIILTNDMFYILHNGSMYSNYSKKLLSLNEYEVHENVDGVVTQITVCLNENIHFIPYSLAHYWLTVITLSISIICLILHLVVYGLLKKLRNCPGKVLMSLSSSLLCGHFFLLLSPNFTNIYFLCYFNGIAVHIGYLSAFAWMSVMAFDIHRTFSSTQSPITKKTSVFLKYSLYAWAVPVCTVALSILCDKTLPEGSEFRPKYGDPICWFNEKKGLMLFFVVPASGLLLVNIVLFAVTALYIRKVSQQTKMVNNFSDRTRYFLYLKLCSVLGVTWILGIVASLVRVDALWYVFILLNGLQGALIFSFFTLKRNILQMLVVKLRMRSDKYRMGKHRGFRAAMFSSLSNIATLQTSITTSSSLPSSSSAMHEKGMLKAVRKINPD